MTPQTQGSASSVDTLHCSFWSLDSQGFIFTHDGKEDVQCRFEEGCILGKCSEGFSCLQQTCLLTVNYVCSCFAPTTLCVDLSSFIYFWGLSRDAKKLHWEGHCLAQSSKYLEGWESAFIESTCIRDPVKCKSKSSKPCSHYYQISINSYLLLFMHYKSNIFNQDWWFVTSCFTISRCVLLMVKIREMFYSPTCLSAGSQSSLILHLLWQKLSTRRPHSDCDAFRK